MTDPTEVVVRLRLEYPPGGPSQVVTAPADNQPLLYRVRDAANLLAISETVLYDLIARGEVESLKIGGSRRITRAALEAYIAKQAGGNGHAAAAG
jgi:excisionase family DNA binding protein